MNVVELEYDVRLFRNGSSFSTLDSSDILPEVFQAVRAAEERRKVRRIDHYDVSGTFFIWR